MTKYLDFLVSHNVITSKQAQEILNISIKTNSPVNKIISNYGYVNEDILYSQYAKYLGLGFCNNMQNTIKISNLINYQLCIENQFIIADGFVITSQITDKLKLIIKNYNYSQYTIKITTPENLKRLISKHFDEQLQSDAIDRLHHTFPQYSSKYLFKSLRTKICLLVAILIGAWAYLNLGHFLAISFILSNICYLGTLAFKARFFFKGLHQQKKISNNTKVTKTSDINLPIYTILIPLFKEDKVINKLINAIRSIDYPKCKLDVKLIVEEQGDDLTLKAIKRQNCESMFDVIIVPESYPQTKPKACNYALSFAKGEYVAIYDAEDICDPYQLKKALNCFENSSYKTVCVQAKLNFFNKNENLLTRMFAIEYSGLFDFKIKGLKALNAPIPLGGTSNHFKIDALKKLCLWDAYNVTEDADLGLRIYAKGWQVEIINSTTYEEAPISYKSWINQRSRWIKGHMQTYFVHMRNPVKLIKEIGLRGFLGFQMFIGAPALVFLLVPIMLFLGLLVYLNVINTPLPDYYNEQMLFKNAWIVLITGAFLQILFAIIIISKNKWFNFLKFTPFYVFYWILHSVASLKALWQLVFNPHYWEKTEHGNSDTNH